MGWPTFGQKYRQAEWDCLALSFRFLPSHLRRHSRCVMERQTSLKFRTVAVARKRSILQHCEYDSVPRRAPRFYFRSSFLDWKNHARKYVLKCGGDLTFDIPYRQAIYDS